MSSAHENAEWERWVRSLAQYPQALARNRERRYMEAFCSERSAREMVKQDIMDIIEEAKDLGISFP